MANETKSQHYVPRTYLKNFSVKRKKNYYICAADKDNLCNILFSNIVNVCLENNIYTLKGETSEQRQAVEKFYSENIESNYQEVYNTLTDKDILTINKDMHYKIILTVITLLYRTSKLLHLHNDDRNKALERVFSLCKQENKDYFLFKEARYSIKGKTLKEIQNEFKKNEKDLEILTQLDVALRLAEIRCFDGIIVTKVQPEDYLITSDNPVILSNIQPGNIAPFDPENSINLPIDDSHVLTILPHSQKPGINRIIRHDPQSTMSHAKMISNNTSQLQNCFRYIIGNKKGLTNLNLSIDEYRKLISAEQKKKLDELRQIVMQIMKEQ